MAAVAATSRAILHGLPSPRSPTLSDAGMILPEGDHFRSFSPNPYIERPPSPPILTLHTNLSHVKLATAPKNWRRPSHQIKSPPLSAQSSRSTLRTMGDSNTPAKNVSARGDPLASSPTIQNGLKSNSPRDPAHDQRRLSNASSTVMSEDFENWPGFDSHDQFDDSGLGLEDQEKRDQFPTNDMDGERWLNRNSSGSDESDNPYSSAALSRRAEIILANAKKRLNVMEGNLRGARESLVVSPTFNASKTSNELSLHLNTARERDRRLYAGLGPIPPRMPSFRSSPLSNGSSPSHSRGLSETSVRQPFASPAYITRSTSNKRASSAIGHTSGPWSPEGYGQGRGRFPIKESRSYETIRDSRSMTFSTEQQWPVRTSSRGSRSPPALETLLEDDDGHRVHRSSSAASSLRDQMKDLKGRISNLKLKAHEDSLRRQSEQNLRTPSPFTSAQEWQSSSDTYYVEGTPVAANAGLGIMAKPSAEEALFDDDRDGSQTIVTTLSQREGEELVAHAYPPPAVNNEHPLLPHRDSTPDTEFDDLESYHDEQDFDETEEGEFMSVDGDEMEEGPESIYEDAVYEMPATERHEDRVDAFDYEHFFLHSAMGTYSQEGGRSRTSSNSSTATTRPVTAVQIQDEDMSSEKRVSYHQRSQSTDSVSTVASFATAAENHSDDEDENEKMDHFSDQILAQHQAASTRLTTANSHTSLRSDSAINMRHGNGSSPNQTIITRASSSPADLASGLQVSKIFSILTESSSPTREEPRLALNEEEKQLIYSLAASFQQVSSNLQHAYGEQYERKEWRRRLDEARRILNGEEDVENDDSF
ncbi:hypothetical protein GQ44DRAFT_738243 [Phaeosphaeriaceae sp. PMI808]|nr:hypothetical protein GQ44DRAFT_738243 [Phaeosphaeriaceae sp. PMI808]